MFLPEDTSIFKSRREIVDKEVTEEPSERPKYIVGLERSPDVQENKEL